MRVLTVDNDSLRRISLHLAHRVKADGFEPDMVIGIITGGDIVGRIVHEAFAQAEYVAIRQQRPSKHSKQLMSRLLHAIPRSWANLLRMAESEILQLAKGKNRNPELEAAPGETAEKRTAERILIVDDAIDSGRTMMQVRQAVAQNHPGADIRSAVITVTFRHPAILPDYHLFNNQTLIRFPWSPDA